MKGTRNTRNAYMQVLSHIAERLKDLHEAGYAHRDIKPGNIMWLPRKKRWTLIDFGCAARIGTKARTGFSLYYVAPEALRAYIAGKGDLVATEALDAWSLGVLALELFGGKPAFDHLCPREQVCMAPHRLLF
jgi:serine/threonine protein kinase